MNIPHPHETVNRFLHFFWFFLHFFLRKILLLARIAVAGTVMEGDFALQEGKKLWDFYF